jgi:hypothetical protein
MILCLTTQKDCEVLVYSSYLSGRLQSCAAAEDTDHGAGPGASTSETLCGLPSKMQTAGTHLTAQQCQNDGKKQSDRTFF